MLDSYLYVIVFLAAAILLGLILSLALKRRRRLAIARPVSTHSWPHETSTINYEVLETTIATSSVGGEDGLVLALRQNLLLKALGNTSVVDRLVALERTKNPTGDQVQWLDAAIRRWEHDNDRR